jgi:Methyltransferase domain
MNKISVKIGACYNHSSAERYEEYPMTIASPSTPERELACYGNQFRQRRMARLLTIVDEVVAERGKCRILDIGGVASYWQFLEPLWRDRPLHITMVNTTETFAPDQRFSSFAGDARDLHHLNDLSFDLVHSNSVIEHVGLFSDMRKMANEVRRLAKRYFVQTPNFWFPVEPHLRTPFIHWLPMPWRVAIVKRRACGYYPRARSYDEAREILDDASLLDAQSLAMLFPDAVIEREQFAGITKSLMAIR